MTNSPAGKRLLIVLAYLAVCVFWGGTYIWNRMGLSGFPAFFMAGMRFTLAGAIMLAALRAAGFPWPEPRQWVAAALMGFIMPTIGSGGVAVGQLFVGAGIASLLYATVPIWAAVFGLLVGRRLNGLEWLGVLVGFAGVLVLRLSSDLQAQPIGAIILLTAAASWAFGSTINSRFNLPKGMMSSPAQLLPAGLFMLIGSVLMGERVSLPGEARPWLGLAGLVFLGSIVSFTSYTFLLRNVRPTIATSYIYVNPLVAIGLGALLEGETVTWVEGAALVVILSGVALVMLGRSHGTLPRVHAADRPKL